MNLNIISHMFIISDSHWPYLIIRSCDLNLTLVQNVRFLTYEIYFFGHFLYLLWVQSNMLHPVVCKNQPYWPLLSGSNWGKSFFTDIIQHKSLTQLGLFCSWRISTLMHLNKGVLTLFDQLSGLFNTLPRYLFFMTECTRRNGSQKAVLCKLKGGYFP